MSKVKQPPQKKRLSLARDHRVFKLEGDKTFRKKWPRKKAKANRRVRRAEQVALQEAAVSPEEGEDALRDARKAKRSHLEKVGVVTLEQQLAIKADPRLRWTGVTQTKNKEARAKGIRRTRDALR